MQTEIRPRGNVLGQKACHAVQAGRRSAGHGAGSLRRGTLDRRSEVQIYAEPKRDFERQVPVVSAVAPESEVCDFFAEAAPHSRRVDFCPPAVCRGAGGARYSRSDGMRCTFMQNRAAIFRIKPMPLRALRRNSTRQC